MRAHDESVLSEVLPPEERVIEAVVARYQRVAPAVTRFARTISGNDDLRVRLGSQASASANEIVIDPGVFQAAYSRAAPVTPTEVALTSALHEAIHLIATDFDEQRPIPDSWMAHRESLDTDGAEAPPLAELTTYEWTEPEPTDADDRDPYVGDDLPTDGAVSLLDALHMVAGPAAEAMFLSIEDARQERKHLAPFPGARSVLSDLYRAAVPGGLASARPLGQFGLACFLIVGDYLDRDALQKRVEPHVALAIDDAMAFLGPVSELEDPWTVGGVALQLIELARMHGILTEGAAADSPLGRSAGREADQSAIAEGVDAVRVITPPLVDKDSYEQTRKAAQTVSAEHGKHGEADQAGDPATDQLMRVSTSPTVYLPTGQAGKLLVTDFPRSFERFGPQDGSFSKPRQQSGVLPRGGCLVSYIRSSWPISGEACAADSTQEICLRIRLCSSGRDCMSACSSAAICQTGAPTESASLSTARHRCCNPGRFAQDAGARGRLPPRLSAPGRSPGSPTSCRSSLRWPFSTVVSPQRQETRSVPISSADRQQPARCDAPRAAQPNASPAP